MKHIFALIAMLAVIATIHAQSPQAIPYQAAARSSSGDVLISTPISVRFSIHDATTDGTIVYSETHSVTTSAQGMFSVNIGQGTPETGTFADINWGANAKYMQVELDPAGGSSYISMGTQQMLSVPYALHAGTSGSSTGWADSAGSIYNTNTTQRVGIGTHTPAARLHVADSSVVFTGPEFVDFYTTINPPISGAGSRMMWYADKAAFRAGIIYDNRWDKENIGPYSIAMGLNSMASGISSLAIGEYTTASGYQSTAFGGFTTASGFASTATGNSTTASGDLATSMGVLTHASGHRSTAMGMLTVASGENSTATGYSTTASGENSTATGYSTTASGINATAIGKYSFASEDYSFASGLSDTASGIASTALGRNCKANGYSSIAIGAESKASETFSIAIGQEANASGHGSIAIGVNSTAIGYYSTSIGGVAPTASGDYSTAMGSHVSTNGKWGAFAIGDYSSYVYTHTDADNQMMMRFAGGYKLYTDTFATVGVSLAPGGNSWATISDRNKKENFAAVDGAAFLRKIAKFNLTSWNYKGQDPATHRHYGPMAQDFYAAFGKDQYGTIGNDTTISQADMEGVSFIAIQALAKENEALKEKIGNMNEEMGKMNAKINSLTNDNQTLKAELNEKNATIDARFQELERKIRMGETVKNNHHNKL